MGKALELQDSGDILFDGRLFTQYEVDTLTSEELMDSYNLYQRMDIS